MCVKHSCVWYTIREKKDYYRIAKKHTHILCIFQFAHIKRVILFLGRNASIVVYAHSHRLHRETDNDRLSWRGWKSKRKKLIRCLKLCKNSTTFHFSWFSLSCHIPNFSVVGFKLKLLLVAHSIKCERFNLKVQSIQKSFPPFCRYKSIVKVEPAWYQIHLNRSLGRFFVGVLRFADFTVYYLCIHVNWICGNWTAWDVLAVEKSRKHNIVNRWYNV